MENMPKSIKKSQSPTAKAESTNELPKKQSVKLENGSSNEETEEETEDGQQDREEVDSMAVEMDKEEVKESAGGQKKQYSEEEPRIMNELKELSPPEMVAKIESLEKELYELSQREAREITRCKHLDIFGKNRRRSSK
ncbi:hypothetical protein KR054_009784 [Drosophila jambulina]|nr:hypothetical protein KR054_009784 [Drosophila jambulina]